MTLKELRTQKGLTQSTAAKALKVSLRTYITYENDPDKIGSFKYDYLVNQLNELNKIDETHGILEIDQIKSMCAEVFNEYSVKYCYLFGSYAKGTATEKSDVDLLISSDVTGMRYYGMVEKLKNKLKKNVDALDLRQLSDNKELIGEVLMDGIKIYG